MACMPTSRSALPAVRIVLVAARQAAGFLREAALLAAVVVGLELAGPHLPHDGADLIALIGALLVGSLLAVLARAGWMPRTRARVVGLRRRVVAWARGLQPRFAVAFRRTEGARPLPDRTLLAPLVVCAVVALLVLLLGERLFEGLAVLKAHVSYTLYLACLAAIWSLQALAVLGGGLATVHWIQDSTRRGRPPSRSLLVGVACAWFASLVALITLPGAVPLVVLLLLAWWRDRALGDAPLSTYLFCRRDARGRPRTISVHRYLRRVHAALVLGAAVVIVLGQAQRLWLGEWPAGAFAFTTWLGLLSSLCALLLVVRAGVHFQRAAGGGAIPPEVPLTPTLWLRTPADTPGAREVLAEQDAWCRVAREGGWLALRGRRPPEHDYDLVLGDPADPRRFLPRPALDDDDARFQLERRFHVVMRRRFHRAFRSLFKKLRANKPEAGSGFLFCPHVWLVPGVVRDVEPGPRRQDGAGSLAGPVFHGPPYAEAFAPRVRRYIGAVLRDLQVDIIFFEDAITWADLKRVLVVAFEIHDQRRAPLQERHFVGVPRVRVVIQEEAAEPEPTPGWLEGGAGRYEAAASGHARILVVLRDRGGETKPLTPDPADTWIRTPSLV